MAMTPVRAAPSVAAMEKEKRVTSRRLAAHAISPKLSLPKVLSKLPGMRAATILALSTALLAVSAARADKTPCPPHEAGASYPWDLPDMLPGDTYATVLIDVDRTGRPLSCRIGKTNIFDKDTLFQLCNAYSQDWRGPPASAGDPDRRTISRDTVMIGSKHELANQQARRAWFRAHPDERASCYPEG